MEPCPPPRSAAPCCAHGPGWPGRLQPYDTVSAGIEQHRAGKVRILATMGNKCNPLLPDVPTLKEAGIDMEVYGWCGFYGLAGMDSATVDKLNQLGRNTRPARCKPAVA